MARKKAEKKVAEKENDDLKNVLDLRDKEKEAVITTSEGKKEKKSGKKSWLKIIVWAITVIFVTTNLIFAFGIYVQGWVNNSTKIFTKILPYPAARVGWKIVRIDDYYNDLSSYLNYYNKVQKMDFDSEKGKELFEGLRVDTLDLLIEEKIIEEEAKKMGLSVSKDEIDTEYNNNLQKAGGEETLNNQVKELYKWDNNTFRKKIKKALLRQKLTEKVQNDENLNRERKKKAEDILARLKNGEEFSTLAKEFSESPNAAEGGSLGWIIEGTKSEAFDTVAFSMEKGQLSEIVKTDLGFEIVKIEDKKEGEIFAKHILIKYVDFTDWLEGKKKDAGIQKFLDPAKIKYTDKI